MHPARVDTGEKSRRVLALALAVVLLALGANATGALAREAYVADHGADTVTPIDTRTNTAGTPIAVGAGPDSVAITPNGRVAYVANGNAGSVSVIDTQTKQVIGAPIPVGVSPADIAITPDGRTAYVADAGSKNVSVIDTQTNQVIGTIKVGTGPLGVAITPDGKTVYVSNAGAQTVSVIDTQTNKAIGTAITVGEEPLGIAITPDGKAAYVANGNSESVSVIDTQTNKVVGAAIKVGEEPASVAITPDGTRAYVTNGESDSVSVIDTASNKVVGAAIKVGTGPLGIAITPDGRTAYVAENGSGTVSPIDLATGQRGTPIPAGTSAFAVAIVPEQPPLASFSVARPRPGVPVSFDASASSEFGGQIAGYSWAFGDGQSATGGPTVRHTFGKPGSYQATLTVDDGEGCHGFLFTGQTALCTGSSVASHGQAVKVAYPGVRIACPKRAKPSGCKVSLQAVAKKPRAGKNGRPAKTKTETAIAKAKIKAGHSRIVALKPTRKFAAKLASAKKVLVRETLKIDGSTRVSYPKLKVVQ